MPENMIKEVQSKCLKKKPASSKNERTLTLVQKFYCEQDIYDLMSYFKLSQCIRSSSDWFDEAKQSILKEGSSIVRNEFPY